MQGLKETTSHGLDDASDELLEQLLRQAEENLGGNIIQTNERYETAPSRTDFSPDHRSLLLAPSIQPNKVSKKVTSLNIVESAEDDAAVTALMPPLSKGQKEKVCAPFPKLAFMMFPQLIRSEVLGFCLRIPFALTSLILVIVTLIPLLFLQFISCV
jgi:hypothetical protein